MGAARSCGVAPGGRVANMSDVERLLDQLNEERQRPAFDWQASYLDYIEMRRRIAIEELRLCDRILVPAGRLRSYTLPRRVK